MWRWATSSERGRAPALFLLGWLAAAAGAGAAHAQAPSREEALRLAFPGAQIERRTAYLDEAQVAAARQLAGRDVAIDQRVVSYYVAERAGRTEGVAYFDSHRVRTLPQLLLVVVGPDARVRRVEVLGFAEPPEYRAPDKWLALLEGKALEPGLSTRRGVVNLTGATLTANAVTQATRRVLALHAIIRPLEARP